MTMVDLEQQAVPKDIESISNLQSNKWQPVSHSLRSLKVILILLYYSD